MNATTTYSRTLAARLALRRTSACALALLLGLAGGAAAVAAQSTETTSTRWSVALTLGPVSGGPAPDLGAGMRSAGFADPAPCFLWCTGEYDPHPVSRTGWGTIGFPWLAEVQYRPSRYVGAALTLGDARMGFITGFRRLNANASMGEYLTVNFGVSMAGVGVTLAPVPRLPLRLHAGPALYRAEAWEDRASSELESSSETKFGMHYGANLSVRVRGPLAVEARAHYRAVGQATVGPFHTSSHTLPAQSADFTHWLGGVGLGLHF